MAFLIVKWPWDLTVVAALIAYAGTLAGAWRHVPHREVVILITFVSVSLFASIVGVLGVMLPGISWLPPPVLGGLAFLSTAMGIIAVVGPYRKQHPT